MVLLVPFASFGIIGGSFSEIYAWIYQNVVVHLGTAMWATVAPYIVLASFRAFRIKNVESAIMTLCVIFVFLMNAPIGEAMWTGFPIIGSWITDYVQTSGMRVFWLGVAVGMIALWIRILMGLETSPLGFGGEGGE